MSNIKDYSKPETSRFGWKKEIHRQACEDIYDEEVARAYGIDPPSPDPAIESSDAIYCD